MPRPLLLLILALLAPSSFAQTQPTAKPEEPGAQTDTAEDRRYKELLARFQTDYFRVTTLIQIVPHVPFEKPEGNEAGFDVSAAWLGVGGRLGHGIGYFVRGAFERQPALLEATVSYGSDDVRGIVGRQKVPFSAEFLTAAADIDFVNRARIVRQIGPGRRTGAALNASPNGGPFRLRAGVFNASYNTTTTGETLDQSDRGGALVASRVQGTFSVGEAGGEAGGEAIIGVNAGYDTPDTSDRFEVPGRVLLGADARLHLGRILVAGEYLFSHPENVGGRTVEATHGGYATLGYDLTPDDRILIRLDVIGSSGTSSEVLLGYNRTLTRAARVQLNVIVPADDRAEPAQALANLQLAF